MSVAKTLYGGALSALGKVNAIVHGLTVDYHEHWNAELDGALAQLPELANCPHELFRLLATTASPARKRFACISRRGKVLAVVALRGDGNSWTLLLNYIIPGALFPVKSADDIVTVLEALGVELPVGWWRFAAPPRQSAWIQNLVAVPTYRISCSVDFDGYWKEAKNLGIVRKARKQCGHLLLRVNAPGSAEWTIRTWERAWRSDPGSPMADLEDRVAAANYLETRGRHHTLTLWDGDTPVAGHTFLEDGEDVCWLITCRDRNYDRLGVGSALTDRAFRWAAKAGYRKIDIGGDHDYKLRWAPLDGEKWAFTVSSPVLFQVKRAISTGRAVLRGASGARGADNPAATAEAH